MSKVIVDSVIDYANQHSVDITLIPSRRQIDHAGGYVGWTTREFAEYVRSRTSRICLERDHAGPRQGADEDDGYASLEEDCTVFDIIPSYPPP